MAAADNFRANLRTVIEARGLTKVAVAAGATTSRSYLDEVLKGQTEPSLSQCEKLARAVGLPLLALLDSPENFSQCVLTGVR